MTILKNISFAIVVILLMTGYLFGQTTFSTDKSTSTTTVKSGSDFVSVEGDFTIALPQNVTEYSPVKMPDARVKGGTKYGWDKPQGAFVISFVDYFTLPSTPKSMMEFMSNGLVEAITNKGGKLILKKELLLDGYAGLEIRFSLDGQMVSNRYYLVNNRFYSLTSGWKESESGELQLKILDTFKLIDGKAVIAKKLEESTPNPLPQLPIVKKLTTDAQDDELKGKVKSVIKTSEDLTGTWSFSGIKKSTEDYYDEKGNKIKRIFYDYKGNPSEVTVYGFIDGMRVSTSGSLNFEYNPPIMAMGSFNTKPNPVTKPADTRYGTKYEYKYDDKERLSETISYRNNGEMIRKTIYSYDGNKLEETWFDKEGKLLSKTIKLFDDKANLIETIYVHQTPNYPDSKYTYTFQSFDEKGNWTKRTITAKDGIYGGGYKDQNYIEYRTLIYYP